MLPNNREINESKDYLLLQEIKQTISKAMLVALLLIKISQQKMRLKLCMSAVIICPFPPTLLIR